MRKFVETMEIFNSFPVVLISCLEVDEIIPFKHAQFITQYDNRVVNYIQTSETTRYISN